jgi:hypothetical protein
MADQTTDGVFRSHVNRHGYGFQYAVVKALTHGPGVTVAVTEFPVTYRDRSTHIDIVAWCGPNALFVCECKRVEPMAGYWVFARSPFTFERSHGGGWLEELLIAEPSDNENRTRTVMLSASLDAFQIGVELRLKPGNGEKGEPNSSRVPRALADAITQADVGVNGLISVIANDGRLLAERRSIVMLPVIFTTAQLFTTDAPLEQSDLRTGAMPESAFVNRPFVWYEHNVSADLLHERPRVRASKAATLGEMLEYRHTRSMAIVNADGIQEFLKFVPRVLDRVLRW